MPESPSEIFFSVHQLEVAYWYEVDRHGGANAEDYYVEDGIFTVAPQIMTGREEIAAFYRWRANRGDRTARHSISNPRLTAYGDGQATFECMMHLYADDGLPVLESRPAIMIADICSECVRMMIDGCSDRTC